MDCEYILLAFNYPKVADASNTPESSCARSTTPSCPSLLRRAASSIQPQTPLPSHVGASSMGRPRRRVPNPRPPPRLQVAAPLQDPLPFPHSTRSLQSCPTSVFTMKTTSNMPCSDGTWRTSCRGKRPQLIPCSSTLSPRSQAPWRYGTTRARIRGRCALHCPLSPPRPLSLRLWPETAGTSRMPRPRRPARRHARRSPEIAQGEGLARTPRGRLWLCRHPLEAQRRSPYRYPRPTSLTSRCRG